MRYSIRPFGKMPDGRTVDQYCIENEQGLRLELIEYGARITSLIVPDGLGQMTDIVLGFDNLNEYLVAGNSHGAVCGRIANRLQGSTFVLNGISYPLSNNCGTFTAHGGVRGFQSSLWKGAFEADGVVMTLVSPDGDQGFPGCLVTKLRYTLSEDNTIRLSYIAEGDRDTVVNLTNHSFFNLAGKGTICNHELWLNAPYYTPCDEALNTTGEIARVAGTAFDFTSPALVGARFSTKELATAGGYDHNFVLAHTEREKLECVASLTCPENHIRLELYTTECGLQIYTANGMPETKGKHGVLYGDHCGISLQPQSFPDAMRHTHFPSVILRKGDIYRQTTEFRIRIA